MLGSPTSQPRPRVSGGLGLCYITDRHALRDAGADATPNYVCRAIRAGVDLVQIREKDLSTRKLADWVAGAVECARDTNTRIVVNDRLDVALAFGAAGVHLGTRSLPADVVRGQVPEGFLVGVSCHSLPEVLRAESAGADYVLLGPIFPTPSKLAYGPPLGLDTLKDVARCVKVPLLALGGITMDRVESCLRSGAIGIAGISIFQQTESIEARVRALRAQLQAVSCEEGKASRRG